MRMCSYFPSKKPVHFIPNHSKFDIRLPEGHQQNRRVSIETLVTRVEFAIIRDVVG